MAGSGKFSTALKLSDLNDFIAPSQACVVSLSGKKQQQIQNYELEVGKVNIQPKTPRAFDQTNSLNLDAPVKVTLHDCLACSGCITSAETVMLEQQSIDEFSSILQAGKKAIIVSLSPQSRASLAAYYNLTQIQVFKKITTFLKSLGVKAVFDTSSSRDLCLIEACKEFVLRYKKSVSAGGNRTASNLLPMLASACPGWICYAEKTLDSDILPHISSIKSPQQAMGAIIKRYAYHNLGLRPEDIYHVTVMPCYDKKLEASRDDFIFDIPRDDDTNEAGQNITEVDCVLTSGEFLDLLQAKDIKFELLEESQLDRMLTNVNDEDLLYGVPGGSGGYAECIFRYAAKTLFGKEFLAPLQFKTLRNADFQEISLEVDGDSVLRFACAYGFRNIQNLVRKIKVGKCEYHYVEIMACPSGCLNGGGQIKPKKDRSPKDLIQFLEGIYLQEVNIANPFENPIIKELYNHWLQGPGSDKAVEVLYTGYHHREKTVTSQLANW